MTPDQQEGTPVFRVIDAFDAPYFGQILKLRLLSGKTPTLKEIKGGVFKASSPKGEAATIRISNFSLINGKPNQARFSRTGRVDVVATGDGEANQVSLQWTLTGPS
jgi:hypothetical protein